MSILIDRGVCEREKNQIDILKRGTVISAKNEEMKPRKKKRKKFSRGERRGDKMTINFLVFFENCILILN